MIDGIIYIILIIQKQYEILVGNQRDIIIGTNLILKQSIKKSLLDRWITHMIFTR